MGKGARDAGQPRLPARQARVPVVIRRALLDRIAGDPIVVLDAAAGYGKTTLALQIRDESQGAALFVTAAAGEPGPAALTRLLRRAARAGGMSDLTAALGGHEPHDAAERLLDALARVPDPVLLVIDDIHELDAAARTLAITVATSLPAPHRAVLAGRQVPAGAGLAGVPRICAADLAFSPDELAELLIGAGLTAGAASVRAALAASGGWPTLAALLPGSPGDAAATPSASRLDALVEDMLSRLDAGDRRAARQLAHLTPFSARVADAVAGRAGTVRRLMLRGLPLTRTQDGEWDVPGPVAARLAAAEPLAARAACAASPVLVAERAGHRAARLLLDAGRPVLAAEVLAGLDPEVADEIGIEAIAALTDRLPDAAVAAWPAALLRLAQLGDTDSAAIRSTAIGRLDRVLRAWPDPAASRELDAERARDLIWDETTRPEAAAIAARVLAAAGRDEVVARARALDVAGRCASWYLPFRPAGDAEPMLAESARLALGLGRPVWAVQALVPLALGVYAARGDLERALRTLQDALDHLPFRSRTRAMVLSFLADLHAALGRFGEGLAAVAEMREIAGPRQDHRILATASWSEAILRSHARDRDGTVRAVLDVERHRGSWFDQAAGAEFLAYAAYLLDRVGEVPLARHYLDRARARGAPTRLVTSVFEAQITARSADPALAERQLAAALAAPGLEPRERPYLMLLRAYAALRRADPAARRLASDAFGALLALGGPHAAWIREPEVIARLLELDSTSAGAVALAAARGQLRIEALGRFQVRRGALPVALPPGLPALAVRAAVAHGGRIRAEALIELLWPDCEPAAGRNRLRNVLSRIRSAAGDILLRDGELLTLPASTEIDAHQFAEHVRAATGPAGSARARSAIALYRGDFLPDDLDDWADLPRQRYRRDFLAMLDIAADAARRKGEIDEAIRLTERAVEAEPLDEARYLRLAGLLELQGRRGSASAVLLRARRTLTSAGIEPSAQLSGRARQDGRADADRPPPRRSVPRRAGGNQRAHLPNPES